MKNELRVKLQKVIEEGTLLEYLEEVGYIKTDFLSDFEMDNIDDLITVLDEDYSLPCRISIDLRGHVLENEHFEENKRGV